MFHREQSFEGNFHVSFEPPMIVQLFGGIIQKEVNGPVTPIRGGHAYRIDTATVYGCENREHFRQ